MRPPPCDRRWLAAATAAALLLAGCGSGGGPHGANATVGTGAPRAGAANTILSTDSGAVPGGPERPADQYLAIVAPANKVVAAFNALTDPAAKLAVLHDLSTVLRLMEIELRDVTWPAAAQGAVATLVAAASASAAAADFLVSHPSSQASTAFAAEVVTLESASSAVRSALGLPPQRSN